LLKSWPLGEEEKLDPPRLPRCGHKTFIAKRLACALIGAQEDEQVQMIQFHPTYAYEDYIQGFRPEEVAGTNIFRKKDGVFLRFFESARENPTCPHVFIIDEINRGHLGKIFGEVMMLIKADKRGPEWAIPLTYSGEDDPKFDIPEQYHAIVNHDYIVSYRGPSYCLQVRTDYFV
jgi:5-methylcytosine-specific restriction enzyme B